jgi:hypothetical protein
VPRGGGLSAGTPALSGKSAKSGNYNFMFSHYMSKSTCDYANQSEIGCGTYATELPRKTPHTLRCLPGLHRGVISGADREASRLGGRGDILMALEAGMTVVDVPVTHRPKLHNPPGSSTDR